MRKVFNFGAGPAMLPEEVLLQAQAEMLDWHGTGMSIMEMGHRGSAFKEVAELAEADFRELMAIPKNYNVLFVAGGATTQFSMVPMNMFNGKNTADYIDTGIWSKKAIDEAKRFGEINLAAKLEIKDAAVEIPPFSEWNLNPEAAYLHYTPNETIEGVEFHWVPKVGPVPLVADMTSCILSRPVDVNEFGIIYAGAQKNIGQAGLNVVIIHEDLVKEPIDKTPILFRYKTYVEHQSCYNTPPTYAWYIAGLVFAWMKKLGGLQYFEKLNQRKSEKIYHAIDNSGGFYINGISPSCRSIMNIPFNIVNQELHDIFLKEAAKIGLNNLKGHRLAGGVRASIYNAMPEKGVDLLVEFMREFHSTHG